MSEWQRDWAREATVPAIAEVTVAHGGASGISFLNADLDAYMWGKRDVLPAFQR